MAKNIRAFGQAVEQGKTLFFATGRTITDARRLLGERALAAMSYSGFPGVYSDGAMVFDDYGNLISETYLDSSLVEKLASEAAKDCKKYAPVLFTAYKTYLICDIGKIYPSLMMKYRGYDYLATLDPYDVKYFKILSVAIRHSNDLLKELHGFEGKYKTIPISLGYHKFVPPNVNKAFGIEQLMKYYGTTIKNCGAIGDNFNDIEMLTSCPQSYAVGNATDAAKDAAANVVDVRYDQAAFATVMKKLYGIDV